MMSKSSRNALSIAIVLGFLALLLLSACAQLGLQQPATFPEKLAAAVATNAEVRKQAADALVLGAIDVDQAKSILQTTDAVRQGLEIARGVYATDPNAANARLNTLVATLTALQAHLASKVKK